MLDTTWHYAVVVAIDQYPRIVAPTIDNLQCPLEDARQMEAWLTSPSGGNVDPSRVKVLTRTIPPGRIPPVPIFDEINEAILGCAADFAQRRAQVFSSEADRKKAWQNSRFYFYISGHGMDGEGDDAVLITANATRDSISHISTRKVLNRLKQEKVFGEIIVFADCCREVAGVAVGDLPWDLRNYKGYNDRKLPRTFVAHASRNRKLAYEPPSNAPIKNSIFTQALLEGLQGGVPGDEVNSDNLTKFLYQYVPKLAMQFNNTDQDPEIDADPDIIFVEASKDYQVTLTARPASSFAPLPAVDALVMSAASIRSRTSLPSTAAGVFTGRLKTGYYAIVPPGGDPMKGAPVHALSILAKDTNETIG